MVNKVLLKDIATITTGSTAPKDKYFSNNGLPFIRAGHLETLIDKNNINELPKIDDETGKQLKLKKVNKGTILFAKSGMSSTKNRVYICTEDAYIVNHLAAIIPDSRFIDNYFLKFFLEWFKPSRLIIDESYPSIRTADIGNIEIQLPSLENQMKIVKILNKAKLLIKTRKAQIEALDQLTQSVFLEMFGDIRINSKKYKQVKLNEVITKITTGKSLAGEGISEYKVLKTSAVSYKFFKQNEVKYLPQDYVPPVSHIVNKGDVLVSRMNTSELVGAAAYVFDEIKNIALPDRIWKLHYSRKINPIFLWYFINQSYFRDKVTDIATGTSGSMKNISQKKYLNLSILLPDISLQNKFAEFVYKIQIEKDKMDKGLIELNNIFNSLMQHTFNGKLFPE
ncbi:restriction endonuclease subunit S [Caldifermentibacillus hisashii]|uniref:restriction endonuclease subunit S n=1 Tax=Caldifermentibacillus hisashii TaxID=996558 RepID=UPI002E20A652|nr:restriction endonuclease subunit S [Caldifermentibacillus hisashii]MED4850602.1 restriction endonuclease subunit S [Caldifermentibacillus hisashii]